MALTNRNEIRDQILNEREYFERDTDRALQEMADSLCPVYYSEILADWAELPNDARDEWQVFGVSENATIFDRMTTDLYWFNYNEVANVWAEIEDEDN